jgi:hypothetical protein
VVTRNLISLLRKLNITKACFKDNHALIYVEGRVLPKQRVRIVESEEWVGSWWKERRENVIRLDNKIEEEHWLLSLAVHEVVEKWLMYDSIWKLPYDVAHSISNTIERRWHVKKWGLTSWNTYMKRVEQLWEKDEIYKQLREIASKRGINLGELIRTVIIPEWLASRRTLS